jgi:hypothetical protein
MAYYKKTSTERKNPLTLDYYIRYESTDTMPTGFPFTGWTTILKPEYDTGVAYNAANPDIKHFLVAHPTYGLTEDGTIATNALNTIYVMSHHLSFTPTGGLAGRTSRSLQPNRTSSDAHVLGIYKNYIDVVPPLKAFYSSTLSKWIVDHPHAIEYREAATDEDEAMRYVDMTDAEIQNTILEMVLLYNTADSTGLTLDLSSSDISGLKAESVAIKSTLDILL